MSPFKCIKSEQGFVLLFVMGLAVIFSVIAISMTEYFRSGMRGVNTTADRRAMQALLRDMEVILMDLDSCRRTLAYPSPNRNPDNTPAGNITRIYQVKNRIDGEGGNTETDDKVAFEANLNESLAIPYGDSFIKIIGFSLVNASSLAAGALKVTKMSVTMLGRKDSYVRRRVMSFNINVRVNGSGYIEKCGVDAAL